MANGDQSNGSEVVGKTPFFDGSIRGIAAILALAGVFLAAFALIMSQSNVTRLETGMNEIVRAQRGIGRALCLSMLRDKSAVDMCLAECLPETPRR